MLSKDIFLTFTDRNMVRKIALELDAVQKELAGGTAAAGYIGGCLERGSSYLRYAHANSRLAALAAEWIAALEEARRVLEVEGPGGRFFKEINCLYHKLAAYANMPVSESHFKIRTRDLPEREPDRFPCVAVLDNLRSAFNVGTIFRTADGFAAEELLLTGITPGPENNKVQKTSMGAWNYVPNSREESTVGALRRLKERGYTVYALETVEGSVPVFSCTLQFPLAILLGNEEFGVLEDSLELADHILRIPMYGKKNSFNVGVSFGMVLFEARRQWQLIRAVKNV